MDLGSQRCAEKSLILVARRTAVKENDATKAFVWFPKDQVTLCYNIFPLSVWRVKMALRFIFLKTPAWSLEIREYARRTDRRTDDGLTQKITTVHTARSYYGLRANKLEIILMFVWNPLFVQVTNKCRDVLLLQVGLGHLFPFFVQGDAKMERDC